MVKTYLGIDIGSVSTKAVVVDSNNTVMAKTYIPTEGDPIGQVKTLLLELKRQMEGLVCEVMAVGTTGSARKLVGAMTGAVIVKNEITAHAIGTLSRHPLARTIFEIGGQDSKMILLEGGIVVDYAMNTLCAAGTGAFLSSQAQRLGVRVEDFGRIALRSQKPTRIAARCTVFAESDMVHKAQSGHKKEDIIAGLCHSVVNNYLNNVGKGKKIIPPIVFQGGVSKNEGVVQAFQEITGHPVTVDDDGHLTGALGVAILARKSGREEPFSFAIAGIDFNTRHFECAKCANQCEIMGIYRKNHLLDSWGNRCDQGEMK